MCLQVAMTGNHGFHKDYAYSDAQVAWNAWNAACDWQKEKDEKEIKRLQEYEWMYKELQK